MKCREANNKKEGSASMKFEKSFTGVHQRQRGVSSGAGSTNVMQVNMSARKQRSGVQKEWKEDARMEWEKRL